MSEDSSRLQRHSKWHRLFVIIACSVVAAVLIGAILLGHYWPFNEKDIIETLQQTVPGTRVTIAHFRSTYFLHPGCRATDVVFIRQTNPPGLPPLVTIQELTIQANYRDLFLRPGYISRITIDGLHIHVPLRGSSIATQASISNDNTSRKTTVGEISSTGALLEIARRDDSPPLKFEIHTIELKSVGADKMMSYDVKLHNPLPPGEIESTGSLGPWKYQDIGQIATSGNYKFDQADLGVFDGIEGILSSRGHFAGTLGQISVTGETDTPAFAAKSTGHPFSLKSRFQARVNGTNGDVALTRIDAVVQNTKVQVRGSISGKSRLPGKITSLDLEAQQGFVQDVLRPFVKAPQPPMKGLIGFRAHVTFPSGNRPFLKRVRLTGDFTIHEGTFTQTGTQSSVNKLSANSRGLKDEDGNAEIVESTLSSHIDLSQGVAQFLDVSFSVPGALAKMNGTFNVINEKVDFHGTLKTDVELSKTTHGIKAILLKPLDPLFKRKRGGASIPVEITGTYSNAHFGMEVIPKH